MNLHNNQIQFSAPKPTHVQFAHRTNETAGAAKALTEVVYRGLEAKAEVDDQLLASRLKTAEQAGLDLIEKAKEKTADYTVYGQQALQAFAYELDAAPADVKERFLRRNPTAVEDYELAVNAAVALKTGNQIYNQLDKEVNRLASTVLNAPAEQRDSLFNAGLSILNNPALSSIQLDNLTYKYSNQVEEGILNTAILTEDYDTAFKMLDDVNVTSTLSTVERLKYKQDINNTIAKKQEAELKAKEEAIEKENKRKEAEIAAIEKAYERADKERTRKEQQEEKAKAAAEKEAKERKETLSAYITETYADLRRKGDFQGAEAFRESIRYGREIEGLGSISMLSAEDVAGLESKFKQIQSMTEDPTARALASTQVKSVMRPLLTEDIDGVKYDKKKMNDSIFYDLTTIKNDREMWNNLLSDTDREEAARLLDGYASVVAESLLPYETFPTTAIATDPKSFYKFAPLGDIGEIIRRQEQRLVGSLGGSANVKAAAQRLDLATDKYNEEFEDEIKPGTRGQALLFSTIGLASTDDSGVSASLKRAGAIKGDNESLSEAFVLHKESLRRIGALDSTDFTEEDVKNDIAILIDLINNNVPVTITDENRTTITAISQTTMMGVNNPQDVDISDYRLEDYYPTSGQAKAKYTRDQEKK